VVDAELQEDRLAVLRGGVLRDLDAVDGAILDERWLSVNSLARPG